MGEFNFMEIFRQLQSSGLPSDVSKIGEFLRSSGVSPDNPEAMKEFLQRMGLDEQGVEKKEDIISLINQMTAGLSTEMRQQVFQIIEQILEQLDCGELPQEIAEFLAQWKNAE